MGDFARSAIEVTVDPPTDGLFYPDFVVPRIQEASVRQAVTVASGAIYQYTVIRHKANGEVR